jgi:virginiamycin A acetyltransferase
MEYFKEEGHTIIGNDVWIGANALILSDIVIGDGAIIAANSTVTKNIPPYAIVGGSPAKIIRFRYTDEQIKFLIDLSWWDKDEIWLQQHLHLFQNDSNFFDSFNHKNIK